MRLPQQQENWTGKHADKAIAEAWRLFERYEARVDFDAPQEKQDELYRPYLHARELAIEVARYTGWRVKEAENLP